MTDKEIIKALETCLQIEHIKLYCCDKESKTTIINITDIRDLINRQQAEIEILKTELNDCEIKNYDLENRTVYAEAIIAKVEDYAIKEFAEKLKEKGCELEETGGFLLEIDDIDNLVKEKVGAGNDT